MAENGAAQQQKKAGKGAFALGLVIVLLAVVGLGFLIHLGIGQIRAAVSNDKDKETYESFLYPVVMLDPDTFDDITGADMDDLLVASILSLLTESDSDPYQFDFVEGETSGMAIPQTTVESAFRKLFGTEVRPVHASVECSTCIFEYQPAAQRYVIPITGYDPAYTPRVTEIKKSKEGIVTLTVGYIAYGDWETDDAHEFTEPEPAKYRKITLRMSNAGYYISAIQNANTAAQLSTTTQVTRPTTTAVPAGTDAATTPTTTTTAASTAAKAPSATQASVPATSQPTSSATKPTP